ncbi:MAG TPA: TolC family protein [Flavisolibacter sp.]|nr:TolC family protein [Flavisolibacter sp.]
MNRVLCLFIVTVSGMVSQAQTYTLEQAIDTALASNIPVRQNGLLVQTSQVYLNQARLNRLPYLTADVTHGIYNGRSIDPSSNGYVNQNLNSANYQLNSGFVLFNGGSIQSTVKQNEAAFESSKLTWQQAKDNLVLNVILAYLQVLNNEDLLTSASNQAAVSQKQLDRLDILNRQGAIKPSEYSDLKGQYMNDQLSIVSAKTALEESKLSLAQLMNKQYDKNMKLERIDVSEFLASYNASAADLYKSALEQFPLVKSVELQTKSFAYGSKAARGALFPTISIGGGLNTNYSSIAQNAAGKISYNNQLKNNVSTSVGLGVSIPIFNRMQQRNRVKLADIQLKNSELEEEKTKTQLQQQVDQAYLNMTNAYDRYKVLVEQVAAYNESFKAAEVRYNAGVGTSIDYLTAKDRLDRANINLISAKYDFVLRKKVLDYYSNPTTLRQ